MIISKGFAPGIEGMVVSMQSAQAAGREGGVGGITGFEKKENIAAENSLPGDESLPVQ
jgi:hypothetical protein